MFLLIIFFLRWVPKKLSLTLQCVCVLVTLLSIGKSRTVTGLTEMKTCWDNAKCWQSENFCTMERAKGTPRAVGCLVPEVPFFWEGLLQGATPNIHPKGPAGAHSGHGGLGQKHSVCRYYWHCIYFHVSERKAKISFCFGGCLPPLGKPWLVGRTFPGTDFMADLTAVAISQLSLSSSTFPLAMPWLESSKKSLLPLHSYACTHL